MTPAAVQQALEGAGYLADMGLATSIHLAMRLHRPLFLEGEPGVGKTEVAKALARWQSVPLIRLQCYEGLDVSDAVYEWDYSRQLLHLRAAEARGEVEEAIEDSLYAERFLLRRPLLQAIDHGHERPPVLLVDEIDRADDEFEAFLLELLSDYTVTVPELGTLSAAVPPIVVITSNRTRDVHDALRRRCLFHWVPYPDAEREISILRLHVGAAPDRLVQLVAAAVAHLRSLDLFKPPGVAEAIDWTAALVELDQDHLEPDVVEATLGSVLKYQDDQDRVRSDGIDVLVGEATRGAG